MNGYLVSEGRRGKNRMREQLGKGLKPRPAIQVDDRLVMSRVLFPRRSDALPVTSL